MKLKPSILGLALAGAAALCCNAPAEAQQRPIEPYYFAPKVVYSNTKTESLDTMGRVRGGEFNSYLYEGTGRYKGKDQHDKTFGGGAAVGYDFGAYSEYPVRLELEYLSRGNVNTSYPTKSTASDASASFNLKSNIQTVMANAYLDFPTDTAFTPYVGAGLGGAYVDTKIRGYSDFDLYGKTGYYVDNPSLDGLTDNYYPYHCKIDGQQSSWNFAWQVSAGFSYQVTDAMALDLSYRYSDFGNAEFGSNKRVLAGELIDQQIEYDETDPNVVTTPGTNQNVQLGTYDTKGKYNLSAHEVILGLRISAF